MTALINIKLSSILSCLPDRARIGLALLACSLLFPLLAIVYLWSTHENFIQTNFYQKHFVVFLLITTITALTSQIIETILSNFLLTEYLSDTEDKDENRFNLQVYKTLFEQSSDAMLITNAQSHITHINKAFSSITGYSKDEVIGKKPKLLSSGKHNKTFYDELWKYLKQDGFWQGVLWNKRKNNEFFPAWQTINVIKHAGHVSHYVSVFSDITQMKKTEEELWQLAYFDQLTGLGNRKLLRERIFKAISAANRSNRYGALLFIDMDNFKEINDSFGHDFGDQVLKATANRIELSLRTEDTVSRLGGDEFIILVSNLSEDIETASNQVYSIIEKLLGELKRPLQIKDNLVYISISIGGSLFPSGQDSPNSILKQADAAMYAAKKSGKNTFRFFYPEMQESVEKHIRIIKDLKQAISNDDFGLLFQPQFNPLKELIGFEALIIWNHSERGLIPESDFLSIAEENGLIINIGEKALTNVCTLIHSWQQQGFIFPDIAIKISSKLFCSANFVDNVKSTIKTTKTNPHRLIFEITEKAFIQNIDNALDKIKMVKQLGIRFSIDNFGTGYSSIAYLNQLPLDQLKIAPSFIKNITNEPDNAAIVETIITLGEHLSIDFIADGVETQEQAELLFSLGCKTYQGQFFSPPLTSDKAILLTSSVPGPSIGE